MEVKNRELIKGTTDWTSPLTIEEIEQTYSNEWLNLDNLLKWEDKSYAIVEKGVRKNVQSNIIKASDFNFNIDNDYEITTIEVRLMVLDDTKGGTNIKDNLISINDIKISPYSTFWNDDNTEIRTYIFNNTNIDFNNIEIKYSCIGTGSDYQIPLIYGIQCRLIYWYYEDVINDELPQYYVNANLSEYELQGDKNTTTLTIDRYCLNGKSGLFGNVYINLSNNLKFNDNSNKKIINATNTNNIWTSTEKFIIRGIETGLGKITITSSSINVPIILYVLIDNNIYYNDNYTVLEDNIFNNCTANERGGAIYNNSYLNNSNSTYNLNNATIEGNNLYEATTEINPLLENEYEAGTINFSCEVKTINEEKTVDKGIVELYNNSNLISTTDVGNDGIAIFNVPFEDIGEYNLKFKYVNSNLEFGNSATKKTIKITKKNTTINIIKNTGEKYLENEIPNIQQNNYMIVRLIETTSNLPIPNETIIWEGKKYITDENGYAYLIIIKDIGELNINLSYNGNDYNRECNIERKINVTLKTTILNVSDLYTREKIKDNYIVKLMDNDGNGIAGKYLYVYMENTIDSKGIKDYKLKTDKSGNITIPIEFNKGIWVTTNTFESDGIYEKTIEYTNIICYDSGYIETLLELDETTIKGIENDKINISGRLTETIGKSGIKTEIQIIAIDKINNKKIYKQLNTNIDGYFNVDLKLDKGEYVFQVVYLGSNVFDGCIQSGNIAIIKTGDEKCIIESANYKGEIKNIENYKIKLTDIDGVPLINRKILFNFKKSNKEWYDYEIYTDERGIATAPSIGLKAGVYLVKSTFLGDEHYKGVTNKNILIVNNTSNILESKIDLQSETVVNDKRRVTFVLSGVNVDNASQNITLSRQYVSIATYNDKGYIDTTELVTNDNGGFYIDLDTNPQVTVVQGIYTGSSLYKDYEYTHIYYRPLEKGTITTISAKNVELFEGENKYYIATLKDNNNNLLKDKIICTEFIHSDKSREIIYTKTNELGEIQIELSNFSPDIYTVKSYFEGDNVYRSAMSTNNVKINQNANKIPTVIVGEDYRKTYMEMLADEMFDIELTAGVLGNLQTTTNDEDIVRSNKLAKKKIVFFIQNLTDGTTWTETSTTNNNGLASISLKDWVGTFKITYTFLGDNEYAQSQGSSEIEIRPANEYESLIECYDQEVNYGENTNINIRLMNELPTDLDVSDEGKPIAQRIVNVKFINRITQKELLVKTYTSNLGRVKVSLLGDEINGNDERKSFFTVGIYDVIAYFEGDNNYKPCEKQVVLKINPTGFLEKIYITPKNQDYEIISNVRMSVGDSSLIVADFTANTDIGRPIIYDDDHNLIDDILGDYVLFNFYDRANRKISYMSYLEEEEFDGEIHTIAKFDLRILAGGIYDCYIEYPTQTNFIQNNEVRIQVEIIPRKPTLLCLASDNYDDIVDERTFNYENKGYLKTALYYDDGKYGRRYLDNEYVFFVINDITYYGITGRNDENYPELDNNGNGIIKEGIAKLSILNIESLPVGSYIVNCYNLGSNNIESSNMTFTLTITSENAWINGLDDNMNIYYGIYENLYKEGDLYDVNLTFEKVDRERGNVSIGVPVADVKIRLKYWYYNSNGVKVEKVLNVKKTDSNGRVKFQISIPKPMEMKKVSNENGDDGNKFMVFLNATAINDNYKDIDGNDIEDNGRVTIKRNDVTFHNYTYLKPTIIEFEVNETERNSWTPNPNSVIKDGIIYIDINKV